MKREYKIADDFFIVFAVIMFSTSIIMKYFNAPLCLGLTYVGAKSAFSLGLASLLLSIALNLQELNQK